MVSTPERMDVAVSKHFIAKKFNKLLRLNHLKIKGLRYCVRLEIYHITARYIKLTSIKEIHMTTINSNLFYGNSLKLSLPREEDVEIMLRWGEDSEYIRNVDTEIALPKTKEQLVSEGKTGLNEVYFRLRTIDKDRLIGFVAIHSIEWNNCTGLLSIGIGESSNRNKGYGSDALKLI